MVDQLAKAGDLERLRAAVVIDMIGDRDLGILRDAGSTPWLTDILWKSAAGLGHGAHFLDEAVPMEDDHVPFLRAGIPSTLLIDYDYGNRAQGRRFWHSPDDTLDKLSPKSLQIVGEVIGWALPAIERELDRRNKKSSR
jgi:Zn-dependent M28 family amino/carboxypeptidase